jgi:hypothetical protein
MTPATSGSATHNADTDFTGENVKGHCPPHDDRRRTGQQRGFGGVGEPVQLGQA